MLVLVWVLNNNNCVVVQDQGGILNYSTACVVICLVVGLSVCVPKHYYWDLWGNYLCVRWVITNPLGIRMFFGCSRIFSDVLGCSRMLSDVLGCYRIFSDVLGCSRMFSDVLGCPRMFSNVLGCSRMFFNIVQSLCTAPLYRASVQSQCCILVYYCVLLYNCISMVIIL
jgi:hypothetical protein